MPVPLPMRWIVEGMAVPVPLLNQQVSGCRRFWVADFGTAQTAIAVGIFG